MAAMTLRPGIDLVEVDEVAQSIRTHGQRYLRRVYTARELADSQSPCGSPDALRLAARFAAKEATLKALGAAQEAVPWKAIEAREDASGHATVKLTGAAAALARAGGVARLELSLTTASAHAAAMALAFRGGAA
jgi:holo-[acyl-carrier protein] synthase